MKKTIAQKWFVPLALTLSAVVYYSFDWPNNNGPTLGPVTELRNSTTNQYEYFFKLASLPTPADSFDTSHTLVVPAANDFDNWRVLATFDDGTYWMGTKSVFESTGFTFDLDGAHTIDVELAPTYDDGNTSPGRIAGSFTVGTGHGVTGAAAQRMQSMPAGKLVRLSSSLSPRKDNILTYIIEYQNPVDGECANLNGELKLYVDKDVINYSATDEFETAYNASYAVVNVNGVDYKQISLPFQNLDRGRRRNAFVRCTTATAATVGAHFNTPWVDFIVPLAGSCIPKEIKGQSSLPAQTIVDSHDPNHKFAAEQEICMTQDSVTFTVSFQNNGTGPTDKIVVEDELHYLLKNESPELVSWSTYKKPAVTPPGNDRKVVFTLNPYNLHGLNEGGLNHSFSEADTKASITFRCAIDPAKAAQYPCNAILNRARIRFDCNPWMETDLAIANIRCQNCDSCQTVADSSYFVSGAYAVPANGSPILTPDLVNLFQLPPFNYGFNRQLWYPGSDLNQPTDLNPIFVNPKHNTYTLILSQGNTATTCTRGRLDVTYDKNCDLGIQVDASGLQIDPCTGVVNGTLTATATGSHSNNLQWHECGSTGLSMTRPLVNTTQLKYYFGLTDEDTGCSAEIIYEIKLPPCKKGGGGILGDISLPVVLSAIAALFLLLFWGGRRLRKKR